MPSASASARTSSATATASPRPPPAFILRSSASTREREKRGSVPPFGANAPRTWQSSFSGAPSRTVTVLPPTDQVTAEYLRALSKGREASSRLPEGSGSADAKPSSARSVALPPTGRPSASGVAPPPRSPSESRSAVPAPHRFRSAGREGKTSPPANRSETTDIFPSVSVPVLSVKSRSILPAASMPTGLRTST